MKVDEEKYTQALIKFLNLSESKAREIAKRYNDKIDLGLTEPLLCYPDPAGSPVEIVYNSIDKAKHELELARLAYVDFVNKHGKELPMEQASNTFQSHLDTNMKQITFSLNIEQLLEYKALTDDYAQKQTVYSLEIKNQLDSEIAKMLALTVDERLEWIKLTESEKLFNQLKEDFYSFSFNHPLYIGDSGITDDEMRHSILDVFNAPRFKNKTNKL